MYEQSETGASLGFLGTAIFTIIMLYIPLAQSRYRLTKDWRSFLSFKLIKTLIFHRTLQLFIPHSALQNVVLKDYKVCLFCDRS